MEIDPPRRKTMICQRCKADESRYRVYTDIINLEVCPSCAIPAIKLGLAVEVLPILKTEPQLVNTQDCLDLYGV
jgi:hypothetical protein